MGNGYWQKTLRVNLTTGDIRVEAIEENDLKAFIGGAGLAAEILRREIPQKIDQLLQGQEGFRRRMQKLRSRMVFNIGDSIQTGAKEIARLADEIAAKRLVKK